MSSYRHVHDRLSPLLAAPTAPRAMPLFRLSDDAQGLQLAPRRRLWDDRMRRNPGRMRRPLYERRDRRPHRRADRHAIQPEDGERPARSARSRRAWPQRLDGSAATLRPWQGGCGKRAPLAPATSSPSITRRLTPQRNFVACPCRHSPTRGSAPWANAAPTSTFKPDYCTLARKFCMLGATNENLAESSSVSRRHHQQLAAGVPRVQEGRRGGRAVADADVAEKLYQRATGYERPATRFFARPRGPAGGDVHLALSARHRPPASSGCATAAARSGARRSSTSTTRPTRCWPCSRPPASAGQCQTATEA